MAVVYYPLGTELYKRTTSTGSLVELVLNAPPNAVFVFTGSSEYSSSFQFDSASYAKTASVALNATPSVSASWASSSLSASYALNGGSGGSSTSASWASSSLTASAMTPTMPYATILTSSTNWITMSYLTSEQFVNLTTALLYNFTCSDVPASDQVSSTALYINYTAAATSSLSFPSNWVFMGTVPTYISSSRSAVLSLKNFGGTVNVAAFAVQY